jgi:hypothetical protein
VGAPVHHISTGPECGGPQEKHAVRVAYPISLVPLALCVVLTRSKSAEQPAPGDRDNLVKDTPMTNKTTDPLVQLVQNAVELSIAAKGLDSTPAAHHESVTKFLANSSSATVKAAAAVEIIHRYAGGDVGDDCKWCHLLTDVFISSLQG